MEDLRLTPKERKHTRLWQLYLWWRDMVEIRKKHTQRIKAAERGKSNFAILLERELMEKLRLDANVKPKNKAEKNDSFFQMMVEEGEKAGPIWDWLLSHKGIGESLAAQIIAQVDDIAKFDSIAKLWRYAGYGINHYWVDENDKPICPREGWKWIEIKKNKYRVWTITDYTFDDYVVEDDKKIAIPQNLELDPIERVDYLQPDDNWRLVELSDRLCKGYHAPYNTPLKSILWNLMDGFVKQQTPYYVDLYYSEKERLAKKHPDKTTGHIDNMAKRKVKKEFLKNLWLNWRKFEGLPVSDEF